MVGLGINMNGNNWKYAFASFLVMFFVQVVFRLDELLATTSQQDLTLWILARIFTSSAVATLIYYGFNKQQAKEKET